MTLALSVAAAACFLAVAGPKIFSVWKKGLAKRDAAFYQPLPDIPLPKQFHRSGKVTVLHSAAALQDLVDDRGVLPTNASVDIAYHTSFDYSSNQGEDESSSSCDPRKHILIIHGTSFNKDMYHWTKKSLRAAGYEDLASVLSPQLESRSIVDRLHEDEPGVCVSTIDLRGHGDSSVTRGPWTVGLLAADVAEALRQIHGNDVKVHAYGLSLGFGIVLKLAMDHPEMVHTVSGGGFLADMTVNTNWAGYFFSRAPIVKLLGVGMLAKAGEAVLICAPKGFVGEVMRHVQLEGYLNAAQSWLHFNEGDKLSALQVPVLLQYPVRDDLAGCTLEKVRYEFDKLPANGNTNKMIYYNETGIEDHCHSLLDPDTVFGDVLNFVRANSGESQQ